MNADGSPLMPAGYDLIWSLTVFAVVAVVLALVVSAIVSLARRVRLLEHRTYLVWLAAILLLPVLGSLMWFSFGKSHALSKPNTA